MDFPWIYFGKSERCLGIIQEFKFKKLSPQIKISKKNKKKKIKNKKKNTAKKKKKKKKKKKQKKKKNSDVLRGFDFWNITGNKKLFCQTFELPKLG